MEGAALIDAQAVAALLRAKLQADFGGELGRAAWRLGMNEKSIQRVLDGGRLPGPRLLKYLGLRRVMRYEPSG